jgi:succinyl-diaminopimelate desuccinylase
MGNIVSISVHGALVGLALVCSLGCTDGGTKADANLEAKPLDIDEMRSTADAATTDMTAFVSRLVQFRSIEPPPETPEAPLTDDTEGALQAVLDKGVELGLSARRSSNGRVGILEYGDGEETVGAVVHLDVVPAGDESTWTHAPFSGEVIDGAVWGRGAQDDKGAGASVLWAAKMLIDSKVHFPRRLRLLFGTSEEVDVNRDMKPYFDEEGAPAVCLVPDAFFINNGEPGYMNVVISFAGATAASSSARDQAVLLTGGQSAAAVPAFAYAVFQTTDAGALRAELDALVTDIAAKILQETGKTAGLKVQTRDEFVVDHATETVPTGDLVLSSVGVAFHSSVPQVGRNALIEVALTGARLAHLADNGIARAFRFLDANIGLTVDGSLIGLKPSGAALETTLSVDLATMRASDDKLDVLINCRARDNASNDLIYANLTAPLAGLNATASTLGELVTSYHFAANDPVIALLATSYKDVLGKDATIAPCPGGTYAKVDPTHLTIYGPVLTPDDNSYFHVTDERVTVASLGRNAVLFAHALQTLLLAKELPVRTP